MAIDTDWQRRIDQLNALYLIGADAQNRGTAVSRLANEGGKHQAARVDQGPAEVDEAIAAGDSQFAAAQGSWAATTEQVHESADRFGIFIVGGAPIPFAPDGSAQPALNQRLEQADQALADPSHPKASLREELGTHRRAAAEAYGARPTTPTYGPPYTTRTPLLGGIPGSSGKSYSLAEFERDILGPLVAESDLLIDELS